MRQAIAGNGIQTYVATEYRGFILRSAISKLEKRFFMYIDVIGHYFYDRSIAFNVGLGTGDKETGEEIFLMQISLGMTSMTVVLLIVYNPNYFIKTIPTF